VIYPQDRYPLLQDARKPNMRVGVLQDNMAQDQSAGPRKRSKNEPQAIAKKGLLAGPTVC
jgi:hypothetical protein